MSTIPRSESAMEILSNAPLREKNTLALPGIAQYFCEVESLAQLQDALVFARENQLVVSILGGGSNTVVQDSIPGLVIQVVNRGLEVISEDDASVLISVAAGENWHDLVMTTLANGWYGLENLVLIPGCVGAAPIQNIGAYGVELSAFLVSVETFDIPGASRAVMTAEECRLAYRDSIFKHELKHRVVIWSVQLRLLKHPAVNLSYRELANAMTETQPDPLAVARTVMALRQSKLPDPARIPNVGSFFKNPVLAADQAKTLLEACPDIPRFSHRDGAVKFPAAWLIDRAGWKGVRQGNVGVHHRQALVLVHYGQGNCKELLLFSRKIAKDIKVKYNIDLEMEPVVFGEMEIP